MLMMGAGGSAQVVKTGEKRGSACGREQRGVQRRQRQRARVDEALDQADIFACPRAQACRLQHEKWPGLSVLSALGGRDCSSLTCAVL